MPPKPKLTPEEKKALKAQKKADKKLRALEVKKQRQRDELFREIKYSQVTLRKQEKNWRQMLINIALPEMRKDLEFAWHNFEMVIDFKDFTISLLMDEIENAEEQYMLNLQNHVEHINKLIIMFKDRICELNKDYENQVEQMEIAHTENIEEIKAVTTEEENFLKTMAYMLQVQEKEYKRTVRAEYFSKIEEEETKYVQIIQRLRGILEQVHLKTWKETTTFLDSYNDRIKERKKSHDALKTQDDRLQKLISLQQERIRKNTETIRGLKHKMLEKEKILGRKLTDLQSEYDFFTNAFNTLKKKLAVDRTTDFEKLKILTVNFSSALDYLEGLQTKGEHLLHVGAVCRKLETLEEKIRPYPVNFINEMHRPQMPDVNEYVSELDLFWQRVGKADASRYAVNEEREFLITENEILKMRLHQYCQCLKCPSNGPFKDNIKISTYITEGVFELQKYNKHSRSTLTSQFSRDSGGGDEEDETFALWK